MYKKSSDISVYNTINREEVRRIEVVVGTLVLLCRCPASGASFVLHLVPVLAGKDPVKVVCSGDGGLARFQIFPGYTWIRRMRVQMESCCWSDHVDENIKQAFSCLIASSGSLQIKDKDVPRP